MANYVQKSYIPRFGNMHNPMDTNIVEDIAYLVGQANSGGGNQQTLGTSIWANGFRIIGCIGEDITLPENANTYECRRKNDRDRKWDNPQFVRGHGK